METQDMRSLSPEAREERRRLVVRLRKKGLTYEAIAEQTGLTRTGVFDICKRVAVQGAAGLVDKPVGRKLGTGRALTAEQEAQVQKLIRDKTPDQLKMGFALWSRSAVRELIRERFGVKLQVRAVGNYLGRWGFTPQKPIKRAYERRPEAVQKWLDEDYPQIAARAKEEGAEIHWGDETGLRSDDVRGRSYAPVGQTPVISTVTNQGKVRWKVFEGALNADLLIDFFACLIKAAGRKVFVILDNLKVHHARVVKAWLAERTQKIEVFYLPSYSPELNPDECLNADLKAAVTSKAPTRAKGQLKKVVISHLRKLQKSPAHVRKYFQHRPVRYAA